MNPTVCSWRNRNLERCRDCIKSHSEDETEPRSPDSCLGLPFSSSVFDCPAALGEASDSCLERVAADESRPGMQQLLEAAFHSLSAEKPLSNTTG